MVLKSLAGQRLLQQQQQQSPIARQRIEKSVSLNESCHILTLTKSRTTYRETSLSVLGSSRPPRRSTLQDCSPAMPFCDLVAKTDALMLDQSFSILS